jgi:hypothetical protein
MTGVPIQALAVLLSALQVKTVREMCFFEVRHNDSFYFARAGEHRLIADAFDIGLPEPRPRASGSTKQS